MSRLSPNCSVMRAEPTELVDVISATSAIWPRCRSSGPATVVATSAGLAPGRVACTEMVGISTSGGGDPGSLKNAIAPAATSPNVSSVVATGRRMKGLESDMCGRDLVDPIWVRQVGRPSLGICWTNGRNRDAIGLGLRRAASQITAPIGSNAMQQQIHQEQIDLAALVADLKTLLGLKA